MPVQAKSSRPNNTCIVNRSRWPVIVTTALITLLGCVNAPSQAVDREIELSQDRHQQRQMAASGITSGSVSRVDASPRQVSGPRIATYLVRADTTQALTPELVSEFLALLQAESGFDDTVVKRCKPGTSVGLLLSTDTSQREFTLDFGCERITFSTELTNEPQAHFFDPSRDQFARWVTRAMPGDTELKTLLTP